MQLEYLAPLYLAPANSKWWSRFQVSWCIRHRYHHMREGAGGGSVSLYDRSLTLTDHFFLNQSKWDNRLMYVRVTGIYIFCIPGGGSMSLVKSPKCCTDISGNICGLNSSIFFVNTIKPSSVSTARGFNFHWGLLSRSRRVLFCFILLQCIALYESAVLAAFLLHSCASVSFPTFHII